MKQYQIDAMLERSRRMNEDAASYLSEEEREIYEANMDAHDAREFMDETRRLRTKFLELVGRSATLPREKWRAKEGSSLETVYEALFSLDKLREDERVRLKAEPKAEPWVERGYWVGQKLDWEKMVKHATYTHAKGMLPHQRSSPATVAVLLVVLVIGMLWVMSQ